MGATGAQKSPDEFNGALGTRRVYKGILDDTVNDAIAKKLNPNYKPWGGSNVYRTNCALCATAFALQARGYNVEAQPRDSTWRGFTSIYQIDFSNTDNYVMHGDSSGGWAGLPGIAGIASRAGISRSDVPRMPRGATAVANKIESKMKSWGDGSVAILNVKWKGTSSAHAINVVNQGGVIKIVDAQCGKVTTNLQAYLSQTVANHTALIRVDNATIRSNPKDLNKIVKVKGGK